MSNTQHFGFVRWGACARSPAIVLLAVACGSSAANRDDALDSSSAPAEVSAAEPNATDPDAACEEPAGALRVTCPCGSWLRNPMRATLLDATVYRQDGNARIRIDELMGDAQGFMVGDEITAKWSGHLPCSDGCADAGVGDTVLAFYQFPDGCEARSSNDCVQFGRLLMTKWAERVLLARTTEDYTFAIADMPLLQSLSVDECVERFGDAGRLPCASNDVWSGLTPSCESDPSAYEKATGAL